MTPCRPPILNLHDLTDIGTDRQDSLNVAVLQGAMNREAYERSVLGSRRRTKNSAEDPT